MQLLVPLRSSIPKVEKVKHCAQSEVYAGYKFDKKFASEIIFEVRGHIVNRKSKYCYLEKGLDDLPES